MAEFVTVAEAAEIPEGAGRCFEVRGRRIAVFNVGGEFHAVDDTCPHAEASLSEGELDGREVTCPWHFATFDVTTGACTGPPAAADLGRYRVRVTDGRVEVEVG